MIICLPIFPATACASRKQSLSVFWSLPASRLEQRFPDPKSLEESLGGNLSNENLLSYLNLPLFTDLQFFTLCSWPPISLSRKWPCTACLRGSSNLFSLRLRGTFNQNYSSQFGPKHVPSLSSEWLALPLLPHVCITQFLRGLCCVPIDDF